LRGKTVTCANCIDKIDREGALHFAALEFSQLLFFSERIVPRHRPPPCSIDLLSEEHLVQSLAGVQDAGINLPGQTQDREVVAFLFAPMLSTSGLRTSGQVGDEAHRKGVAIEVR
jgi:hypothetical protein